MEYTGLQWSVRREAAVRKVAGAILLECGGLVVHELRTPDPTRSPPHPINWFVSFLAFSPLPPVATDQARQRRDLPYLYKHTHTLSLSAIAGLQHPPAPRL